ncbi:MAG: bifunctional DNA-formamidopyrimidine glycosylase/DNA-(apurinic or apyrimidinic site) lyase [bacterium]
MPELPEVETIVNDLKHELSHLVIKKFELLNQKIGLKSSVINWPLEIFRKRVEGEKIVSVRRRAKIIVIELVDGVIAIHLKMTGQLIFENKKKHEIFVGGHPILGTGRELPNKFTRAIFEFSDDSKLFFNDVRRFGWVRYFDKADWVIESLKFGVEPLENEFTLQTFQNILQRKKNVTIKQAIMDAKFLVGVGNIYADESLFKSGIKPQRKTASLTLEEVKLLLINIPKILKLSIKNRGTSFNDYVDAKGSKGNFVKLLQVYGRAGKACFKCGQMLQKTHVGGRGTVWCDECQK